MSNLKKLFEKKAELKASMQAIIDTAEKEERAISAEETAEFDRLESEIRAVDDTIARADKMRSINTDTPVTSSDDDKTKAEERAFADFIAGKVTEMRAGEQNITMSNNGAVIPESIAGRILDEVAELCPIYSRCEMYHVKGTLKIPKWTKADGHDVTVGFAEEFVELTADAGKFTSIDLSGFLVGALTLIGRSAENNSSVNLVNFVIKKMAEKIAEFLEKALINGSAKTEGALSTGNTETASSATAVTLADLIKLQSSVKQAFQKNACWTMSRNTFTAVKLLTDTNGRPLVEPDITKDFPHTLLGKPVYISENMPEISADAKSVLYGDYSGLSVNMRENISIEVLREKYATQHAVGVCAWFEFDSKVTDEQKLAVLVHPAK